MTTSQRKNVFVSYSHKDIEWLNRLQVHLKPLEQEGSIVLWSDERIQPGSKWRDDIRNAIEQAKVAVLLVSADFLASEFIRKDELPPLLAAAEKENAVILPVIVSPCLFERMKNISQFQAINKPSRTLLDMSIAEREAVFLKVADNIANVLNAEPAPKPAGEKNGARSIGNGEKAESGASSVRQNTIQIIENPSRSPGAGKAPVVQVPEPPPASPVVSPDMAYIAGGWFNMGDSDGDDDEKPVHEVWVNDFYLGKYEVTLEEFREFTRDIDYRTDAVKGKGAYVYNGSKWEQKSDANWLNPYFKQTDKHPVVCVSWNDAIAYCNWRSGKEGLTPVYTINDGTVTANFKANGYRLPTEAEWEYAARCGKNGYKYSWGDGNPSGTHGGNIADVTLKQKFPSFTIWDGYDDGYVYTAPVGSFAPNEFELYDLTGNVWEWCWDWYGKDYYRNSPNRNPLGPSSGSSRVVRGGAWNDEPDNVRAAYRSSETPGSASLIVGIRLSRTF